MPSGYLPWRVSPITGFNYEGYGKWYWLEEKVEVVEP